MRKTFWYIVGGQLTTISIPAMAQDVGADPAHSVQNHSAHQQVQNTDQTPAHSAAMEAWPVERKAAYDGWTADAQEYFWTLTPERQDLFFRLRDADRRTLVAMDEADRSKAWATIESRAAAKPVDQHMSAPEPAPEPIEETGTPESPEPRGRS